MEHKISHGHQVINIWTLEIHYILINNLDNISLTARSTTDQYIQKTMHQLMQATSSEWLPATTII